MKIGIDLDGTILDCKLRQTQLLAVLCRACSFSVDTEQYWQLKRNGLNNRAALVNTGMIATHADAVSALWEHAIEDMCWLGFDIPLSGVIDTLCNWRNNGHSLHLLSARRNQANARQQLRTLGLNFFDSIDFVSPHVALAKSDIMAERKFDIYIGDTERDRKCAENVNIPSALVSTGMRGKAYLDKECGRPIFEKISDINPCNIQRNMF